MVGDLRRAAPRALIEFSAAPAESALRAPIADEEEDTAEDERADDERHCVRITEAEHEPPHVEPEEQGPQERGNAGRDAGRSKMHGAMLYGGSTACTPYGTKKIRRAGGGFVHPLRWHSASA